MFTFQINKPSDFKKWRMMNNIKLKEVASYIKVSQGMISFFEREVANMSDENIDKYKEFIQEYENGI